MMSVWNREGIPHKKNVNFSFILNKAGSYDWFVNYNDNFLTVKNFTRHD